MRAATAAAAAAAILGASGIARAQFPGDIPRSIGETPPVAIGVGSTGTAPYWSSGKTRPFLATTFEAGIINLRETLAVGYGRPHWRWVGLEGYTNVSTSGGLEYGGLHVSIPYVDFRTGARYAFDFQQYFLPYQETYFRNDVLRERGPKQRYLAWDSEVAFVVPLPHSAIFGVSTLGYIGDVPAGYDIFDDVLHQVFKPPWYLRERVGYFYAFGFDEALRAGFAAEWIYNPGRDTSTMRVGPVLGLTLSHHLDASASFMVVTASNDRLGLLGGEFTTIGLRYRWATGDRWPEFP